MPIAALYCYRVVWLLKIWDGADILHPQSISQICDEMEFKFT